MLYGHIREHKANHRFELQCIQCYWSRSNIAALYAECIGYQTTGTSSVRDAMKWNCFSYGLCHGNAINVNEAPQHVFFLYRKFTMQQQHPPKWIVRLALPVGKNVAKNLEKKTFRMKMFSFILNSKHFWKRLERTPNLCQSLVKRFGAFSPKPFYKFQTGQKTVRN